MTTVLSVVVGVVVSPLLAMIGAVISFCQTMLSYWEGTYIAILKIANENHLNNTNPVEQDDVWEKHIRKMEEKQNTKSGE